MLTKQGLKCLIKDKTAMVILGMVFSFIIYNVIKTSVSMHSNSSYAICSPLWKCMENSFLYYGVYIVVMVEYILSMNEKNIRETMLAKISSKYHLATLLPGLVLNIFTTIFFIILNLILSATYSNFDVQYAFFVIKICFLYLFLPATFTIITASLISGITNRCIMVLAVLTVIVILSPQAAEFIASYKFADVYRYTIFPDGLKNNYTELFLYGTELFRWFRILTYIFVAAFVWNCVYSDNPKRTGLLFIVPVIFCTAFAFKTHSTPSGEDVLIKTNRYYESLDYIEEPPCFSVTDYKMQIKIADKMYNTVTMNIEEVPENDKYIFTLYHTLKISSIKNSEGKNMRYDRNGDYLTIYADQKNNSQIIIEYSGTLDRYCSTSDMVYLPGTFPYYPIPGFYTVYEGGGYARIETLAANYEVDIVSDIPIYTNLKETAKNKYAGKSDSVFIIGGYVAVKEIEGVKVIYPKYSGNRGYIEENLKTFVDSCKSIDIELSNPYPVSDKTIFITEVMPNYSYVSKDYVEFVMFYNLENVLKTYEANIERLSE